MVRFPLGGYCGDDAPLWRARRVLSRRSADLAFRGKPGRPPQPPLSGRRAPPGAPAGGAADRPRAARRRPDRRPFGRGRSRGTAASDGAWRPHSISKRVAHERGRIELRRLDGPRVHALAAVLAHLAEREQLPLRRGGARLLGPLPAGGGDRILVRLELALDHRPGARVLLRPERATMCAMSTSSSPSRTRYGSSPALARRGTPSPYSGVRAPAPWVRALPTGRARRQGAGREPEGGRAPACTPRSERPITPMWDTSGGSTRASRRTAHPGTEPPSCPGSILGERAQDLNPWHPEPDPEPCVVGAHRTHGGRVRSWRVATLRLRAQGRA